ncbi:MAG: electron transporter RnfD [Candidatus Latescibacterota bacterium]|nr:MAG: electron transporter RnfD [Candidatus Latescibacterota bacterium]
MEGRLVVAVSPHIRAEMDTRKVMMGVLVSLVPGIVAGVWFFRWHALVLLASCLAGTLSAEASACILRKKPSTLGDLSAAVTGVLLAMVLPPTLPFWAAFLGGVVAVGVGKQVFGGLGQNIFNPALVGRAFLMAAFPVLMTTWVAPGPEAVTVATPLALMKFDHKATPLLDLLVGKVGGCMGETSALALLIGGLFLVLKGYADWRIPLSYLGTVAVLGAIPWAFRPDLYPSPMFHLLAGGLMLGAWFMATDPVTTPVTKVGRYMFGIGAGVLVVVIRLWGGLPEGVMYSILLMNAVTPLIDRYTVPVPFGGKR